MWTASSDALTIVLEFADICVSSHPFCLVVSCWCVDSIWSDSLEHICIYQCDFGFILRCIGNSFPGGGDGGDGVDGGDVGDVGDGVDVGDGLDGGDGGALWIPLYEGFPRLGQYRALPVLLLHLPAHHPLNNQRSTVLAMMVG